MVATSRVERGVGGVHNEVLIEVLNLFRGGREDGDVLGAVEGVDAVVREVGGVVDAAAQVHVVGVGDEFVHPEWDWIYKAKSMSFEKLMTSFDPAWQ